MDYVGILKDIISIDTSDASGRNYEKVVGYLRPLFEKVGFETQKIHIPEEHAEGMPGRVNLLCHRRGLEKPRLIFYSHVDVVPAEGWDAFNPKVENGKIYGRGAADMKGAVAALLLGLEAVKGNPLRYDTSVMITTDEETNQASQIRYLAQFLQPVSGAYVFSLDSSFGYVGIANLGVLQVDIKVKGKSVHSGLSHLGENAVEKANLVMEALLGLKSKVTRRRSTIDVHPRVGLGKMEPRLNINKIEGGLETNIIPDQCLISVDRRLIPEENLEEAERELMDTLSSVKGVEWEIARIHRIPTVPPCQDPVVDELAEIIKEVTGQSGKFGEMISGDLPSIATSEWGGREFALGVIREECNIHGKNEFVYQKDIEDLAQIISRFLSVA
ncbi:MAG: M20/M25/M40 family metallo-hydrolase [Dehalococcoidia bacterium]|nr:M20/M25/M40 family metallo-hydrolase [Dehalococcoidia bacterium]